jgi:hypothetical protein
MAIKSTRLPYGSFATLEGQLKCMRRVRCVFAIERKRIDVEVTLGKRRCGMTLFLDPGDSRYDQVGAGEGMLSRRRRIANGRGNQGVSHKATCCSGDRDAEERIPRAVL